MIAKSGETSSLRTALFTSPPPLKKKQKNLNNGCNDKGSENIFLSSKLLSVDDRCNLPADTSNLSDMSY